MSEVISTMCLATTTEYRFRTVLGRQVLEVADVCRDWDTNSGHDVGPQYVVWRKATHQEAEHVLGIIKEDIGNGKGN